MTVHGKKRDTGNESGVPCFKVVQASAAQVCFLDHVVLKHVLCGVAHDDVSRLQDVASVGHFQGLVGVLLNNQNGDALVVHLLDDVEAGVHHDGHETHG